MIAQTTDLIQCGDALWISCGTWIVFWNGLIGALIAAVLAAGVAMLVVWLTTKHHTTLASAEAERQDARATAQLEAQRVGLELQMKEQRDGLKLQLRRQKNDAKAARERAAIVDVIDSIMVFAKNYDLSDIRLRSGIERMNEAVLRWGIENDSPVLVTRVMVWIQCLQNTLIEDLTSRPDDGSEISSDNYRVLHTCFLVVWFEYSDADQERRDENWEWIRLLVVESASITDDRADELRLLVKTQSNGAPQESESVDS